MHDCAKVSCDCPNPSQDIASVNEWTIRVYKNGWFDAYTLGALSPGFDSLVDVVAFCKKERG